eukprot:6840728-Prymnesium_polylepis.1
MAITVTAKLAVSIQDFDADAQADFKARLASSVSASQADVSLAVYSGSVTLVATIRCHSYAQLEAIEAGLAAAIQQSAPQGTFMGLAVEE